MALCIDLLCCNFETWNKQLCRDKSCQFRPPKKAKKEVSLLEVSKTSQYSTKRSGLLMFPEIGKLQVKKISFLYSGQGCLQSVQGLEERLEDLQSLSLNFCLTKFVRTIERAFVQVSHSFANWFLNARVCSCLTSIFGYIKHNPYCYFWAAFTYSQW